MRLWLWEFLLWAAKEWNLVQDVYWWAIDAHAAGRDKPQARASSPERQNVRMARAAECYRNQDAVLWTPSQAMATRHGADYRLAGRSIRANIPK